MRHFELLADGDDWQKKRQKDKILADLVDLGIPDAQDGISFRMSRLQAVGVFDGLANTYLVGEKNVQASQYQSGTSAGDSRPMMVGYGPDTARWGSVPPQRDAADTSHAAAFGSAHAGGWNASYADGSVRTSTFDIDADLHRRLSNRDGINRGELSLPQ
jgi:hypothetical protein